MANKKRLIDLQKRLREWDHLLSVHFPNMPHQTFHEFILASPAVDAVEVVHGRWIVEKDGHFRNVKCSACGKDYACHTGMLQLQNFDYCPNCGAKMDGGNEDA